MNTKKTVFSVVLIIILFALCSCTQEEKVKTCYEYFDTVTSIYSYANDSQSEFEKNTDTVCNVLEKYHKYCDIYHQYTGITNLCTLNENAGKGPVKIDEELFNFLDYAKKLYYITNGEMNVMMGSLLSVWHEARESEIVPDSELLKQKAIHSDIENLVLDPQAMTAQITDSQASIDVGAIAKGYAVEMAIKTLEQQGITGYVINAGGNVRTLGTKKNNKMWTAGIKDPSSKENTLALKIKIADLCCVTSGSYERFFIKDGKKYHHIIDKDTLYPASFFASVSVITQDSGLADALSTALFCMSYEQGLELIDQLPQDIQVIWIFENGEIKYTEGIRSRLC